MILPLLDYAVIQMILLGATAITGNPQDTLQSLNFELLQLSNVSLYCKTLTSSKIMLRCLAEGRSGWLVGYNEGQCLICLFEQIESEYTLFSGSRESLLWIIRTSK